MSSFEIFLFLINRMKSFVSLMEKNKYLISNVSGPCEVQSI